MPPANSPVAMRPASARHSATARTPSPLTYLPALMELASPVLDLASTLHVDMEDEVDSENISFLRTPTQAPEELPAGINSSQINTAALVGQLQDGQRRREVHTSSRRVDHTQQRNNTHETWTEPRLPRAPSPYSDRVPVQQSLYDWAPATEEGNEQELEVILEELREQQPNTHPDILRVLGRAHINAERAAWNQNSLSRNSGLTSQLHEPSLRSAAILQSVRRNHRLSSRQGEFMQRYLSDREVHAQQNQDRQHQTSSSRWFRAGASSTLSGRHENTHMAWQSSMPYVAPSNIPPGQMEALRRRYLHDPSPEKPPSRFEKALLYFHSVRVIKDTWPWTEHVNRDDHSQFDIGKTKGSSPTSWLCPGAVFTGYQQVPPNPSSSAILQHLASNSAPTTSPSQTYDPSRPRVGHNLTATPPSFERLSPVPTPRPACPDRWTVKVSVHDVDWQTMTLQGTMEAVNVPQISQNHPPSSSPKTTFSTFLEGEIIDFRKHTLYTESYQAGPTVDATYWRRLEPFKTLPDEELALAILCRQWMEEQLMDKYVLMRWKEKCFVQPICGVCPASAGQAETWRGSSGPHLHHGPSHASFLSGTNGDGFGLSISGFYYISLCRKDGSVEGLYYDPQSSPYQHLELRVEGNGFTRGAWEFR